MSARTLVYQATSMHIIVLLQFLLLLLLHCYPIPKFILHIQEKDNWKKC